MKPKNVSEVIAANCIDQSQEIVNRIPVLEGNRDYFEIWNLLFEELIQQVGDRALWHLRSN